MLITHVLQVEHSLILSQADFLDKALGESSLDVIQAQVQLFFSQLASHAKLEEALLFRELESCLGAKGTILRLRDNLGHDDLFALLSMVKKASTRGEALHYARLALQQTREHMTHEEIEVFPLAEETMRFRHLAALADQWLARRQLKQAALQSA